MAGAGMFLMTSHPGYEGYARVLVESMASGLPAVVTRGSDTGGLVVDGRTGFICGREPAEPRRTPPIRALDLHRTDVRSTLSPTERAQPDRAHLRHDQPRRRTNE